MDATTDTATDTGEADDGESRPASWSWRVSWSTAAPWCDPVALEGATVAKRGDGEDEGCVEGSVP